MARKNRTDRNKAFQEGRATPKQLKAIATELLKSGDWDGVVRVGTSRVYFLQVGEDGPIKIGVTDEDPRSRLMSCQIGNPWKLRIVAVIPGVHAEREKELHRRFAAVRMEGEWFQPIPELLELIRREAVPWDEFKRELPQRSKTRSMNDEDRLLPPGGRGYRGGFETLAELEEERAAYGY